MSPMVHADPVRAGSCRAGTRRASHQPKRMAGTAIVLPHGFQLNATAQPRVGRETWNGRPESEISSGLSRRHPAYARLLSRAPREATPESASVKTSVVK
jgi:hypothetical protein